MNQQLFKWLHAVSVIIFLFFIGSYSVEALSSGRSATKS